MTLEWRSGERKVIFLEQERRKREAESFFKQFSEEYQQGLEFARVWREEVLFYPKYRGRINSVRGKMAKALFNKEKKDFLNIDKEEIISKRMEEFNKKASQLAIDLMNLAGERFHPKRDVLENWGKGEIDKELFESTIQTIEDSCQEKFREIIGSKLEKLVNELYLPEDSGEDNGEDL